MNILDEDKSNFTVDIGCSYRKVAQKVAIEFDSVVTDVLRIKCNDVRCGECIGHKYNLQNGCPVCGDKSSVEFVSLTHTAITYRCVACKSVFISCGSSDIRAIATTNSIIEIKDDII